MPSFPLFYGRGFYAKTMAFFRICIHATDELIRLIAISRILIVFSDRRTDWWTNPLTNRLTDIQLIWYSLYIPAYVIACTKLKSMLMNPNHIGQIINEVNALFWYLWTSFDIGADSFLIQICEAALEWGHSAVHKFQCWACDQLGLEFTKKRKPRKKEKKRYKGEKTLREMLHGKGEI